MGNYLDVGQDPEPVEVVYMLGGSPYDRGLKVIELYNGGFSPKIVCSGANMHSSLKAFGIELSESDLSKRFLLMNGIPEEAIIAANTGTSTYEESIEALAYAKRQGLAHIGVVSSSYHMRRVRWTFTKTFENSGIKVSFFSAKSPDYQPNQWWRSENGFLIFFNETLKLGYYALMY
jgi:uncharacterized SAM-binding protein YcdF (DUF218 family)